MIKAEDGHVYFEGTLPDLLTEMLVLIDAWDNIYIKDKDFPDFISDSFTMKHLLVLSESVSEDLSDSTVVDVSALPEILRKYKNGRNGGDGGRGENER